jgi:hypothetical protein
MKRYSTRLVSRPPSCLRGWARQRSAERRSARQREAGWAVLLLVAVVSAVPVHAEVQQLSIASWAVDQELVLPGSPAVIYDTMTGDISGWWDHSFSEHPKALYIDAKPGGGFYEIFDDSGDGVKHAEVIYAKRGEMLRLRGPLGFSGNALDMVHTFTFTAEGESTRVHLHVNAAGQNEEGWAQTVDQVWQHFLVERLKPYVEAGKHLKR